MATNKIFTFKHGIHPETHKERTSEKSIERMPFSEQYLLPLSQHIGKPSKPIVQKKQKVRRGEMIAEPDGFVSVALHSPVDGVIEDIGLYLGPQGTEQPAIKIKTDLYSSQQFLIGKPIKLDDLNLASFTDHLQKAGIVGLGGAAFPAHVKFSIPKDKKCEIFMLNGCECEPYLTSDDRIMTEEAEKVLDGMMIVNQFLGAKRMVIAVEDNKIDAIIALEEAARINNWPIEVLALQTKYPQGAEKMMISAILDQEVPSGKLPIDLGVMVSNVGTSVAISEYFRSGMPLIERIMTITGEALNNPSNLRINIGASLTEVLDYCGADLPNISHLILGGPMMGAVQKSLENPVVKGTSGVLVKSAEHVPINDQYNCIRCGRCVDACPLFLNPAILGIMAKKGLWDEMEEHHIMDCFECGSCSYICPSGIPLVQSFRVAKGFIREKKINEKKV